MKFHCNNRTNRTKYGWYSQRKAVWFTSFSAVLCCSAELRSSKRSPRRVFSDFFALFVKVRGTDGDISVQRLTLSNDLWLSVIRVLKAVKFFVRLSHGLHIKCGNLSSCLKVLPYMSSAAASSALFPFLKRCLDQDMSLTAPHSLQELKFLGTDDWKIFFRVCWLLRDDIFSKTKGFTAS